MTDIRTVRPTGRLDHSSGPAFEKELLGFIEAGDRRLLLDLSALDYTSSLGLRILLKAAKQMQLAGGRLAICSLTPQVAEVFRLSGFETIIEVLPSAEAATARLSAP